MVDETFTKSDRVLKRRSFILAGRYGRRYSTKGMILLVNTVPGQSQRRPRLGITAAKKVGKSNRRNRLKRLCREYFRINKGRFTHGHDYVVIFRPGNEISSLADMEARFETLFAAMQRNSKKNSNH